MRTDQLRYQVSATFGAFDWRTYVRTYGEGCDVLSDWADEVQTTPTHAAVRKV